MPPAASVLRRTGLALALGGIGLLLGLPALLLWAALDRAPAHPVAAGVSPAIANEAAQWFRRLDPRSAPFQVLPPAQPALLPAAALQALAQDTAYRLLRGSGADLKLLPGQALLAVSVPLSATPAARWLPVGWSEGLWLNVRATIAENPDRGLPVAQRLQLGALPVPLGPRTLAWARQLSGTTAGWQRLQLAAQAVEHVSLTPQGVGLQLHPPLALAERLRRQFLAGVDVHQLHSHHSALVRSLASSALPAQGALPLSALLGPALAHAQQRAYAPPGAPTPARLAQEFRLALLAVTLHAFQLQPAWLAPDLGWLPTPRRPVALRGRQDHALHFLLSATLAMGADPAWADALGLYKELADAGDPRGSGFSFDDMAADKAGAALGQRARHQPQTLARLLPLLVDDVFLMPAVDGLPSALSAAQFEAQFGSTDSLRFRAQMDEVDRRIQALPLLAR